MLRSPLVLALLPLSLLVADARADCPSSCITLSGMGPLCTSQAFNSRFWNSATCSELANYHLREGALFARTSSDVGGDCSSDVVIEDDFVVQGGPDGQPVSLVASFAAEAVSNNQGVPGAVRFVMAGGGQEASWEFAGMPNVSTGQESLLTLPLQVTGGTPFRMRFEISASASEIATAAGGGTILFQGLSQPWSVTSCNGFGLDPVPTLPVTWGKLRATYR